LLEEEDGGKKVVVRMIRREVNGRQESKVRKHS
jgi:hypothetical protein